MVLDPNELRELGIRLAQNVGNFNAILDALGSTMHSMKDVGPIVNEVIIDATKKLYEFEQKGYFDFLKEFEKIIDNIVIHYGVEDVQMLADNIVAMLDVVSMISWICRNPSTMRLEYSQVSKWITYPNTPYSE